MPKHSQKEIFTALGVIEMVEGNHRFIPNSTKYLSDQLRNIPLKRKISCTFTEHIAERSKEHLAYYWIILGYLANYNGDIKEELHECIMIELFGTKKKNFNGKEYTIRKSVSNKAHMPSHQMTELTLYVKDICKKFGVILPTEEELGYIKNEKLTSISRKDVEEMHKGLELPEGEVKF